VFFVCFLLPSSPPPPNKIPTEERNNIESIAKQFKPHQWRKDLSCFPHITQNVMKGAAVRSFIYFLSEVCLEDRCLQHPGGVMRAACLRSFVEADVIMRSASRIFTVQQHRDLIEAMQSALLAYNVLAVIFEDEILYHTIPKHHMCDHMVRDLCRVNPRRVQCYMDEDMVGRVKLIFSGTHGLTASMRTLHRYLLLICIRWQHFINIVRVEAQPV
jgi:hypothetical protein